ncbi:DUF6644 family protein [Croceibacterium xixiisoli]|uniref:DUF6644 family protein n=1 Tax=Croceibacterium xixiisoli TaxID=1476466 RepID=UPI00192518FA|nr:DUF6644 family protein [Croceibacterium xixiisoli]
MLLWLAEGLDDAGIGPWVREVGWVYPWVNVLHLLGLVMLVGGIGLLDLRVLGLFRDLPLAILSRVLTPVAVIGFVVQLLTGLLLFAADGPTLANAALFQAKLVLLALVMVNAGAFRVAWARQPAHIRRHPTPALRLSALASLLLWLTIAALGRLIAYY